MGDVQKNGAGILGWRNRLLALTLLAVVTTGCASSGGGRSVEPGGSASAAQESATPTSVPRQIEAMELREGAPSTYLDILADGPLVWTSYRDADGNLVI